MPIQNLVSSEKNNITVAEFIGDKDRLFFDVATRTFRLSDGITPGGIVVNTGGGGGGSYTDFSVDLHLNRATASSGDILSWSGTDYAWIAPGIQTSDLSLTTNPASGGGALSYNSGTGAFAFTPPDLSGFATTGSVSLKIGLSDLSVGAEGSASGDGSLAYDNATGVFTYTPPDLSSFATAASVASKIELTDLSIGAEGLAQGDGAIEYNNATGVFKYTPPVIPSTLLNLGISDGTVGQVLQTDGAGNFSFVDQSAGSVTEAFKTITIAGQTNVEADSPTDTLTLVAGSNMTLTTNATGDTITFASTGGGSGGIALTDLSVGTPNTASGAGAISYDDSTGVFKYTPPDTSNFLTSVAFSDLTSTPTTLAGYGITDAFDGNYNNLTNLPTLFSGAFADLTGKPTTIAGYGITDAFDGAFSSLTGKPTTIAGYGITDALELGTTSTTALAGNTTIPADISELTDTTSLLYTDSSVDTHLNQSNPTSGYVLSWNGSDYAWVAQTPTVNPEFTESITLDSDETTDAVSTEFVIFYGSTTNATTTKLYRNSSNASISIAQQTTVFFEADVIGRDDGTPDYGAFKVKGIIDNDSSGNTQLISSQKEIIHAGANNLFDANIVADNTNDVLSVEVNGENSKNIRWSALVKVIIVKQT